jgi:integrase
MRLKADTGESVAPARGMRLVDLIEQWRCSVKLTRRRNTFNSYSRLIDCHIVPQFGNVDPRGLTRNAVEAWHSRLAQRIPVDANRALAVLSVFLSWLVHDGRVERNVALGIKRKPESARHVLLDAAEIDRAHAALDVEPNRCAALALQLAFLTGCRIGEALGLAPEQIHHSRKLWIKPAASTKQARLHITPLSDQALAIARQLLALDRPSYDACRRAWGRARARVGRVYVHIHDMRHSHASALARNGASLPQIGRLLGHTSAATTQRYLHLVDRDLVDLVERTR